MCKHIDYTHGIGASQPTSTQNTKAWRNVSASRFGAFGETCRWLAQLAGCSVSQLTSTQWAQEKDKDEDTEDIASRWRSFNAILKVSQGFSWWKGKIMSSLLEPMCWCSCVACSLGSWPSWAVQSFWEAKWCLFFSACFVSMHLGAFRFCIAWAWTVLTLMRWHNEPFWLSVLLVRRSFKDRVLKRLRLQSLASGHLRQVAHPTYYCNCIINTTKACL